MLGTVGGADTGRLVDHEPGFGDPQAVLIGFEIGAQIEVRHAQDAGLPEKQR